jgi:hypothetical protein
VEKVDEPEQGEPGGSPEEGRLEARSPQAGLPEPELSEAELSEAELSEAELSETGPPEDAESWTDDQWIAWLDATDDPEAIDPDAVRAKHWGRGRSASMLGAAMLGLHEVIYGPHGNEIAIVVDAGGDPPGDDLPEVHLDPEHPERSEVIVRRDTPRPTPEPPDPSGPT